MQTSALRNSGDTVLADLRAIVGDNAVLYTPDATTRYCDTTLGPSRPVRAAVIPSNVAQIQQIVRLAARRGFSLYPISTGNNWGYGSATPPMTDSIILDLRRLNTVTRFCAASGMVELEPGVTQQSLFDYLQQNNLPYMVPTHGGGPRCSVLGNALEKGFGITPPADHFGAVRGLEAVLPDGTIYRGSFEALGQSGFNRFKWGMGPYLDGLFAQSNFGIVTKMQLQLVRKPERTGAILLGVSGDTELEGFITQLREVFHACGGNVGALNLMNAHRILAMTVQYPSGVRFPNTLAQSWVDDQVRHLGLSPWVGLGSVYGPASVVTAVQREIRRRLRKHSTRFVFVDNRRLTRWKWLSRFPLFPQGMKQTLAKLDQTLRLVQGEPSEAALPLAYWRGSSTYVPGSANPSKDGCGLIWYAPIVPLDEHCVSDFDKMVKRVCAKNGIEPLLTLTTLSPTYFDATIPIVFDSRDRFFTEAAWNCFHELVEAGNRLGCFVYRSNSLSMDSFVRPDEGFWKLAGTIKQAIDPLGIFSPGRYAAPNLQSDGAIPASRLK